MLVLSAISIYCCKRSWKERDTRQFRERNGTWEVLNSRAYWNNNDMRGGRSCGTEMKTRAAYGTGEGTNLPNRHVYTL